MRTPNNRLFTCSLIAVTLLWSTGAYATTPFGDNTTVTKPTTAKAGSSAGGVSTDDLQKLQDQLKAANQLAGSDYRGFLVVQPIVQGTITFTDTTKNTDRYSWFKQVLAEHGCQIVSDNTKSVTTGSIFNKKKTTTVSVTIKGRGFVVQALKDYYGGSLAADPGQPAVPTDSTLKPIVDLELDNMKVEQSMLQMAFNVDKLIIERDGLGMLDFSAKSKNDKAMQDLKENQIPQAKARLEANDSTIRATFLKLANDAMAAKDFNRAIALLGVSGDGSEPAIWDLGGSYEGLTKYPQAIDEYNKLTNSSTYGEQSLNAIADCQHLQGNDRNALNELYTELNNFRNTSEQNAALKRISDWGLLNKSSDYPELPQKLSGIYVEKGLQDNAKNHSVATKDYGQAVDALAIANGGSKSDASAKILSDANSVNATNKQNLANARQAADTRFLTERANAQGQVSAWTDSYNRAVTQAQQDYQYDLSNTAAQLNAAKAALDTLTRNPPPTPTAAPSSGASTDPYSSSKPSGSTDPYASKPSGSTDPYASKPSSSTDPYASKSSSSTDPYASGQSAKSPSTDPYGSSNSGSTDPYSNGTGGASTDPYAGNYQNQLQAARAQVDQIQNQYNWLYYNEQSYVDQKCSSVASSLQSARQTLSSYDLANKDGYVNNDSTVRQWAQAASNSGSRVSTLTSLAHDAGY